MTPPATRRALGDLHGRQLECTVSGRYRLPQHPPVGGQLGYRRGGLQRRCPGGNLARRVQSATCIPYIRVRLCLVHKKHTHTQITGHGSDMRLPFRFVKLWAIPSEETLDPLLSCHCKPCTICGSTYKQELGASRNIGHSNQVALSAPKDDGSSFTFDREWLAVRNAAAAAEGRPFIIEEFGAIHISRTDIKF